MKDEFLDLLSIASFVIGLENLELNITQDDFQEVTKQLFDKIDRAIADVHDHLAEQDIKIGVILNRLGEKK